MDTFTIPGTDIRVPLQRDAAPLLLAMAVWWRDHVEPLMNPGCWGHNYRAISGSAQLSNHASGTAIDINAPKHPLGKVGTVPGHLRGAISARARQLGLRWGGDYSGRKDEMHFEVIVNRVEAKRIAAGLPGGGGTPPPGGRPTLQRGSRGADVALVQRYLGVSPADGIFGPATESAVKRYQANQGLVADGVVGPKTWQRILSGLGGKSAVPGGGSGHPPADPALQRGAQGDAVRSLQRVLNRWYPGLDLAEDGIFGTATETAVKELQRRAALPVDGVVGPRTREVLGL
ncbi:peptidoglycan-binding protein [Crossiella sp. NPDC003009]